MGHRAYYDCKITDLLCLSSTFSDVGLAVGIVIGVVILYKWYSWQNYLKDSAKTTLPHGSLGLPFLGETLEFVRAYKANKLMEDFINPHMAKYGQVYHSFILYIFAKVLSMKSL
jgi:predicted negative regulator of RcsB-dependent stress response